LHRPFLVSRPAQSISINGQAISLGRETGQALSPLRKADSFTTNVTAFDAASLGGAQSVLRLFHHLILDGVDSMSIFSKIGHAIGHAVKAVGHGIVEVGKQVGLAAEGVVSGFVLKPVAGVVSLFSQDLASKIKLPNQDQVDHSFMGKIGEFAGTALGFVEGTALFRGIGMGATAARATIGAVEGLAGSKDGNLWQKLEGAGIGALTAGAAGHAGDKVTAWLHRGEDAIVHPLVAAGAPRAVTQVSERAMDAELRSLVQTGHFAGLKELIPATAVSTVVADAGERINHGIDYVVNHLPHGDVANSVDRFLHTEENSLARTGRFADTNAVVAQTLPDSLNSRIDRLLSNLDNSHNRFGQTADQFLHNEVDTWRTQAHFVDPRTAFTQAAAREFTPEINNVIGRVDAMNNPVGHAASQVLHTEADYLRDYGRLYNPGAALERAVVEQVRPAITHAGERLPQPARSAVNDMLDGFYLDGLDGAALSARHSANDALHRYADRVLPERLHLAEHPGERSARIDHREINA
jgi:hypothetical protein